MIYPFKTVRDVFSTPSDFQKDLYVKAARKASSVEEAIKYSDLLKLENCSPDLISSINSLQVENVTGSFLDDSKLPYSKTQITRDIPSPPQYYVLVKDGTYFLVDTQGYNYPRYVIQIEQAIIL